MAYASGSSGGNRAATALGVALLQGAAIYALVTGLAVVFIPQAEKPNPVGKTIPITPIPIPPPPDTKDPVVKDTLPTQTHKPAIPEQADKPIIPPNDFATEGAASGTGTGEGSGMERTVPVDPPSPTYPPRGARPTNKPGTWATAADYPAADLRRESQGVTRFTLSIGSDGKVQSCQVDATSGSPSLDAATCRLVSTRARFKPATDGSGAAVTGSYSSAIRWEIPRN